MLLDCSLFHMDFAWAFCLQQICQHDDPQDESHQSDWLKTNTEHRRGGIQPSAHKRSEKWCLNWFVFGDLGKLHLQQSFYQICPDLSVQYNQSDLLAAVQEA